MDRTMTRPAPRDLVAMVEEMQAALADIGSGQKVAVLDLLRSMARRPR